MIQIIPGILEKDLAEIKRRIALVENYVDWIQIDLLDGTLFPNHTFTDLGKFQALRLQAKLELHLMVDFPSRWFSKTPRPPFKRVIAHLEADEPLDSFIQQAKLKEFEVGVALDLASPVTQLEELLSEIDAVLIMGVNTGFSGQRFSEKALTKIAWVKRRFPNLFVEVDGGMNPVTAKQAIKVGADGIVATSFIFKTNPQKAIFELKNLSR
jgi:ribulose-phosphate 3-epimerase